MDFFEQNLKEVLLAINYLMQKGNLIVNTKKVRIVNGISPENRSKINFIWRSLKFLECNYSILEKTDRNGSTSYKIMLEQQIEVEEFIRENRQMWRDRK